MTEKPEYKFKELGETTKRQIPVRVCAYCNCVIAVAEGCSFNCPYDYDRHRPEGWVIVRVYERTDVLIRQDIE